MQATHSSKYSGSEVLDLIKLNPWATFVSSYHNRPYASHMPFIILDQGTSIVLGSFLEKSNKQWKHLEFEDVLAIFQTPHSTIWNQDISKAGETGRESIEVAHLYGSCNFIHERGPAEVLYLKIVKNMIPDLWQKWSAGSQDDRELIMNNIITFELKVDDIKLQKISLSSTLSTTVDN